MPRSSRNHPVSAAPPTVAGERLQKVLAAAGVGSRRMCEELIVAGRVEVDRRPVTKLGARVDSELHEIRVDGETLRCRKRVWYAVHKPAGVVSTSRDPAGRPRVVDLVPPAAGRLFCVGRLDRTSEGLILLTNDGDLANGLTHPRYGVQKTYQVEVAGHPQRDVLGQLRRGLHLAEGFARADEVRVVRRRKMSTILQIVLSEGRNREVRRLLARVGHKVVRLVRVAVGPVTLSDLPPGAYRPLAAKEIKALRAAIGKRAAAASGGRIASAGGRAGQGRVGRARAGQGRAG